MFHTCWSEGRKKRSFEIVCATTRKETVFNWLLSDELDSLVLNFTLDYMSILSFTHDKETLQPWRHQIKLLRLYFTFSYTYNNKMKKKVEKCSQKSMKKKSLSFFPITLFVPNNDNRREWEIGIEKYEWKCLK